MNQSEFIERSKKIHNDKYDYSKSVYLNCRTSLIITCPIHGDFEQAPQYHMSGSGCPDCAKERSRRGNDMMRQKKYRNQFMFKNPVRAEINPEYLGV